MILMHVLAQATGGSMTESGKHVLENVKSLLIAAAGVGFIAYVLHTAWSKKAAVAVVAAIITGSLVLWAVNNPETAQDKVTREIGMAAPAPSVSW